MQWSLILLFLMGQCCFMDCQLYQLHYINEAKTWTEAQQHCREKHTDLVTVTNMKDMERLNNISAGDQSEAWIGLYDPTHGTRTWHWSLPGVEFDESYTNWNPGEPSDGYNCGHIFEGKLIFHECSQPLNFLCYNESESSKKYYLIKELKTWLEAQSYCRENHTDLISGTKQLQDGEGKSVIYSAYYSPVYIGLFRDTWRWSDGSSFSFRHWNLHFNNQQPNSGQCAVTVFDDGGRWKNENCAEKKPFICYEDNLILIKEKMNWEDALNYCRDHHHDLVSINNMEDQRWIQEKVKNALTPYVWLGLRYTCTLDFWFWVSDEVVIYKNWALDEPMDCDMSGAMETAGGHQWFKRNDTDEFNFICSRY